MFAGLLGAMAQPTIQAVWNASAPTATFPNAGNIAQGSMFTILGTGLGPDSGLSASLPLTTLLPDGTGTSVSVTSGGSTVAAFIAYAQGGQINAVLPSNAAPGQATFTVTYNGQTSAPFSANVIDSNGTTSPMQVVTVAPGISTANGQGFGPAAAQAAPGQPIQMTTPAIPGGTVSLFGTGLGAITDPDSDVPPQTPTTANVTVTVGGLAAQVMYAGRGTYPGMDEIDVQLDPNTPTGCYVPAVVAVNGVPSNDFVLPVSNDPVCAHPFGLNATALGQLDSGGTVNVGIFAAIRGAASGITAEGAGGVFEAGNASAVYKTYDAELNTFHVVSYPVALNSCVVYDELSGAVGINLPNYSAIGGLTELKSDVALYLDGPSNAEAVLLQGDTGGYIWFNLPSPFFPAVLGAGVWKLSGAAGPDVASFSASTEFPANLSWDNSGNLGKPPRGIGLTMLWSGGGTSVQPNVFIVGNSTVINSQDGSKNRGKSFACLASAADGKFVIPGEITSQLPVVSDPKNETANGSLGIATGGGQPFAASLIGGNAFDGGFFGFGEAFINDAKWQ